MKSLTFRINTYFAILLVTVTSSGAALLILNAASGAEDFIEKTAIGQASAFIGNPTLPL